MKEWAKKFSGIEYWSPGFDPVLVMAFAALLCTGLIMVTSASLVVADQNYGQPFYFAIRHFIYLLLGVITMAVTVRIPMRFWERLGLPILFVSMLLLILVLVPGIGREVNGSMRWIRLGPVTLQPSELAKLGIFIYLARYVVKHQKEVQTQLSGFLKPLGLIGILTGLLLLEPDFGAVVVICATSMSMLFIAGARLRQFAALSVALLAALVVLAVSSPYRMARLTSFMDPWADQFDSGYQLTQALIAFGRGEWFGVGLGNSIQKMLYLPEAHTDFLFAVIAEELGFAGSMAVIALFVLFVWRGLMVAHRAMKQQAYFAGILAYGLSIWIGTQCIINIGVNSGMLPTKGLTLPFMSSGGSSILVMCIVVALLLRIDYETRLRVTKQYQPKRAIR